MTMSYKIAYKNYNKLLSSIDMNVGNIHAKGTQRKANMKRVFAGVVLTTINLK